MSTPLPMISTREAIRAFARAGFEVIPRRGKGSHIVMAKPRWPSILTIPRQDPIKRGTLRALIRDSGLTVDEFVSLLQ